MRKVTIGFSRPKGKLFPIFSWLIRLFEGTPYSHVYLRWKTSPGPEVVYEAAGSKVRYINSKFFDKQAETLDEFTFCLTSLQYRQLVGFCMTNVGADYGVLQVFGIALVKMLGLKKNPFADGRNSQICSEAVAYFLQDVLKKEIDFRPEIAGPKEIHRYLNKLRDSQKQEK